MSDQSCLVIKVYIMGASSHATRQSNSKYASMARQSIYNIRKPEHLHSPICRYQKCPQGPSIWPHYTGVNFTFKFGIYDIVGRDSIIGGGSIIIGSIGGMIAGYQRIQGFLESVDPALSSAVLRASVLFLMFFGLVGVLKC